MTTTPTFKFGDSSETLIASVRRSSATCILSFSRGKDSLAAYLALRDKFERIIPYTYSVVPGLEFVEESLAYYEKVMGCHIIRLPKPSFYRQLGDLLYQPPPYVSMIDGLNLPQLDHDDLQQEVCLDANVPYESTYNALGMRAKDSMARALYFQKNGPINHTRKRFYPVFDWDKNRVIEVIRASGIKLPIDYRYFPASYDGLYMRFNLPIKKHFPRDWEKIVNLFPLIELDVLRFEAAVREGKQAPYTG